jgi:hypothetical protein
MTDVKRLQRIRDNWELEATDLLLGDVFVLLSYISDLENAKNSQHEVNGGLVG